MTDSSLPRNQPVVSRRMRKILLIVLVLTTILVVDSIYLSLVTFVQWLNDVQLEDIYYQFAFLIHLTFGIVLMVPTLLFVGLHLRRAWRKPNRLAVRLGVALFVSVLVLFISGLLLTRGLPFVLLQEEHAREVMYWLHVIAPFAVVWIFILHRLAGPRIRWGSGAVVVVTGLGISSVMMLMLYFQSSSRPSELITFEPALIKLNHPELLPVDSLTNDEYCSQCHQDVHAQWSVSAHRFASFNNPAYAFTVSNTRQKVFERDGNVEASRFCAGCHDPVPLLAGLFDDPNLDLVDHPTGQEGITCLTCHAVQSVDSLRGNADFTIALPQQYPFATSDVTGLRWVSNLLIKSNPSLHQREMLKEVHSSAQFCSTCHKVHLPEQLNHYKWLRGQNHYDSFEKSGFSGQGITSFYYPDQAIENCNSCHMNLVPSNDFGSDFFDGSSVSVVHNHQFPAANTAIQSLVGLDPSVNKAHEEILKDALRIDIFGIRHGDDIAGKLTAPIRPTVPVLQAGETYLIEVVVRSLKVGHTFTQGTSDSNEVWLDTAVTAGSNLIGRSGGLDLETRKVDPWAHHVNAFIVDRDGQRIAERNAEDIFVKVYDHQIPPGSAHVVHYLLTLPKTLSDPIDFRIALRYRKFDTHYVESFQGESFKQNDLSIATIATDYVRFPVGSDSISDSKPTTSKPIVVEDWMRWNDYGIGMLLKPRRSALAQAEDAFQQVISLGRAEGYLNLGRVYISEGRLEDAVAAINAAKLADAYPWSVTWFAGQVDFQFGRFAEAIEKFSAVRDTQFQLARDRGFDFSRDHRVHDALGRSYYEWSKQASDTDEQIDRLNLAESSYLASIDLDSENTASHYGLSQVYDLLGVKTKSEFHLGQHEKYRVDDNARDRAVSLARQMYPAANHASEAVVVYDLQRDGSERYEGSVD